MKKSTNNVYFGNTDHMHWPENNFCDTPNLAEYIFSINLILKFFQSDRQYFLGFYTMGMHSRQTQIPEYEPSF